MGTTRRKFIKRSALVSHLGNIAFRTGNKLVYQESTGRFFNDSKADAFLKPEYRSPWKFPVSYYYVN